MMPQMAKLTGKMLATRHAVKVNQSLYRSSGDWYHVPVKFPAALFDTGGYLLFETLDNYQKFVSGGEDIGVKQSIDKNWLTIKDGIQAHQSYISFDLRVYPDEIEKTWLIIEGAKQSVVVNRYERDPFARRACIEHWSPVCAVCGFDFKLFYGNIGDGFIHVHHLTPISSIKSEYELDPVKDLRPVCPNCHAMLHKKMPPFSIDEMKGLLSQRKVRVLPHRARPKIA